MEWNGELQEEWQEGDGYYSIKATGKTVLVVTGQDFDCGDGYKKVLVTKFYKTRYTHTSISK